MRQSRGHVCQRPNIGSRVNREVHARFWERAEVRFLRATRQSRRFRPVRATSALPLPAQPVDATQALNLAAGVSNFKV